MLFNWLTAAIGVIISMVVQYRLFWDGIHGASVALVVFLLSAVPIALFLYFYLSFFHRFQRMHELLVWLVGGLEVGYLFLGFRVLGQWYVTPDMEHLEPLFVSIGVGVAILDWVRRQDYLFDEESTEKNSKQ